MNAKPRFHELDLLRGIACVMVVCFHFLWRGQQPGWIADHAAPAIEAAARHGYLGVHLFFMISGFVIFMTAEGASLRGFAASRVARLYPALWVAAPLTALLAWWYSSDTFAVTPNQLWMNLTMVPQWFGIEYVDGSYWSLAVELQFYLLTALAIGTGWLARIETLLWGWLALALVDTVRPIYPLEFWLAANWAPYFTAGICCYLIRTRSRNTGRWALLVAAYVLAVAGLLRAALTPAHGAEANAAGIDSAWIAVVVVTVFFAVFVTVAHGRWQVAPTVLVRWAGALTYPVYLLHQNIGYLLLGSAHQAGLPFPAAVVLVCTTIVAAAFCIHRWVEKPLAPLLRRAVAAPRPALPA